MKRIKFWLSIIALSTGLSVSTVRADGNMEVPGYTQPPVTIVIAASILLSNIKP